MFLTAFLMGIFGSMHCIGMCGPIALALPLKESNLLSKISGSLTYNGGRILTYAIFGIIFGWMGQGIAIAGYQQIISIAIGILIIIFLFLPKKISYGLQSFNFIFVFTSKLKSKFSTLFRQKNYSSLFAIGLLNGLLPCGLVYLAVAGAIASGNILHGSLFMILFGAGTIPAMLAINLSGNYISLKARRKLTKTVPVFIVAMACLFILRGMNLGIPYLSPQISSPLSVENNCCSK